MDHPGEVHLVVINTSLCTSISNNHISFISCSPTNGFQENHTFSFYNVLPHVVCSVVYHPQHKLLILGSVVGQGHKSTAGVFKEQQFISYLIMFEISVIVTHI